MGGKERVYYSKGGWWQWCTRRDAKRFIRELRINVVKQAVTVERQTINGVSVGGCGWYVRVKIVKTKSLYECLGMAS